LGNPSGFIAGVHVCDVTDDGAIDRVFEAISESDGQRLDAVLHAVAHAPATAMKGTLLDTTRSDFNSAHEVSAYSLIAIARAASPLLAAKPPSSSDTDDDNQRDDRCHGGGGSITTLTYSGSTRATPGYVVMGCAKASLEAAVRGLALELGPPPLGIRVNALSPGPISTLAARGISGFTEMKAAALAKAPLQSTATPAEVGAAACFLASDGAASVTGQVIHMDGGLSAISPC
jgi:enoyl-[acyl-carrier protein] reductase I